MSISFELPTDLERHLRECVEDLDQTAKEAVLVQLYRQNKLTQHELATSLGLSRLETDGLLKRQHVNEDLPSDADIQGDVNILRTMLDR